MGKGIQAKLIYFIYDNKQYVIYMNIDRYFNMAKNVSTLSDFKRHHIGAVMVYKNKVIASEANTMKTNPIQKEYNRQRGFEKDTPHNGSIHAEMACIVRTRYMDIDWAKVSIYVYRELKDGTTAPARPCPACMTALKERGIKNIYYTTEYGIAHEKIGE